VKYNVRIKVTMSGSETETFEAADADAARKAAEDYANAELAQFSRESDPENEFSGSFEIVSIEAETA
jgi:hypothetical protein